MLVGRCAALCEFSWNGLLCPRLLCLSLFRLGEFPKCRGFDFDLRPQPPRGVLLGRGVLLDLQLALFR